MIKLSHKIGILILFVIISYFVMVNYFFIPNITQIIAKNNKLNSKIEFNKIVDSFNSKLKSIENLEENAIFEEAKSFLISLNLNNGFIILVSKDLRTVFHPNKNLENKIIDVNLEKTIESSLKTNNSVPYYYNNIKYHSWVVYNINLDAYVIYSVDDEYVLKGLDNIKLSIYKLSFVLIVILLLFGFTIINRIVKPIALLTKSLKDFENGNYETRCEIKTTDEFKELANHFNNMVDKIQYNIKNLELEVSIRTKELENKIYFDSLTGIMNRNAFFKDTKGNDFVTLILVDINRFDEINDLYGFDIANDFLIEISKILTKFAKENKYRVYKLYGDVFGLVSMDYKFNIQKLENSIANLNDIFQNEDIKMDKHNLSISTGISIGISVSQENPLKTAGIALRSAKNSDRNFFVYNNELDNKERIKEARFWENRIRDAVLNNEIIPFYQPIFDRNNKVIKYEALMRIKNSDTEFITPSKFIHFAKQSKQYTEINLILIEKVLEDIKKFDKQISINIGFSSIQNRHFDYELSKFVENMDKDKCSNLIFEILESEFLQDYKIYENFIKKYKELGVKIAIDDFGSGYSNFKQILHTKPDYIKIDGSLVKNIDKDKNSHELVKYMTMFSKSLNILTVAEYVHSIEVYKILYELGIDEFQGYYLGEPKNHFID